MDTDIRKPVSSKKAALIERPAPSASHTPTTLSDTEPQAPTYTEPLSEDEDEGPEGNHEDDGDDDDNDNVGQSGDPMRRIATDEMGVTGLPAEALAQAEEARAFREKNRENAGRLEPGTVKKGPSPDNLVLPAHGHGSTKADVSQLTPKNLKKMLAQKYEQEEVYGEPDEAAGPSGANGAANGLPEGEEPPVGGESSVTINGNSGPVYDRSFTYAGKRIAVPVRVEPKVNFALERTLLVSLSTVLELVSTRSHAD